MPLRTRLTTLRPRCERSPSRRPGEVRVDEVPEPELLAPDDAIVRVEASGICGSDLHIYHGRVQIEPGFIIGHEFVGEVVAAGDEVTRVAVGDRVLGTYGTACGDASSASASEFHKCDEAASSATARRSARSRARRPSWCWCPTRTWRCASVPDGLSDDVALFAGDVMGTAYHAIDSRPLAEGETAAILGLGPVGLCAVQAAKAAGAVGGDRDRHRRGPPGDGRVLRRDPCPPDRAGPARRGQEADRGPRGGPRRRRRRPPRRARPRLPARPQGRHRLGHRRLRRADRAAHGDRLDQGAHAAHRPRQRDQARRPGARAALERGPSTRRRSSPTT